MELVCACLGNPLQENNKMLIVVWAVIEVIGVSLLPLWSELFDEEQIQKIYHDSNAHF